MQKIDILIAHRGRYEHLATALYYLNAANSSCEWEVRVYVIDDTPAAPRIPDYSFISVRQVLVPIASNAAFSKSKLLNIGIEQSARDFDWLSIVDADMVYSSEFFTRMGDSMKVADYVISVGARLDAGTSEWVLKTKPEFKAICDRPSEDFSDGPSQVRRRK